MTLWFAYRETAGNRLKCCFGPILMAVTFVSLCILSWRRWTDPVIDFGRELYTAWQLMEGKALYGDVEHLYGPFSSCFNAFVFRLGGVSYMSLAWTHVALLGGFTALLYGVWRRMTDRWAATCVGLGFLMVSAFGMYKVDIGNYNFITPYALETVHGLYLATGALVCLTAYARRPQYPYLAAAGLCYGLVFLTKSEVFVALNVALFAYALAALSFGPWGWKTLLAQGGWLAVGGGVATAGLYVFMPGHLSIPGYLQGICRQYTLGLNPAIAGSRFYGTVLGLDRPWEHLLDTLRAAAVIGLCWLLLHALGRWSESLQGQGRRGHERLILCAGFCLAGILFFWDWHYLACLLPLVLAGGLIGEWIPNRRFCRRRPVGDDRMLAEQWSATSGRVLWLGFGLGMLLKSGLNPVFVHYGFCLSAVGLMCLTGIVTYQVPRLYPLPIRSSMRLWLTALLLTGFFRLAWESKGEYARRSYAVGSNAADRFYALPPDLDERGRIMNELMAWVTDNVPPQATLAVIPEGVMLNYQARRVNPNPSINFMVVSMAAYGEGRMLSAFQANPPDYVVFFDRDLTEYGLPPFGTVGSPGALLVRWVESDYSAIKQIRRRPSVTIYRHEGHGGRKRMNREFL